MNKTRNYVFVINNWTQRDKEQLQSLQSRCRYLGYAEEVGARGTPHLQGAICLNNATTMRGLARIVKRAAWKVMGGTPKEARDYYADPKPPKHPLGVLYEYGDLPMDRDGQAKDQSERYATAVALAKRGELENIEPELLVRYYSTFQKMAKQGASKPPNLEGDGCICIWVWGPTRTGKSHAVRTRFPEAYLKQSNKWWCGYDGEKVAYLEDADPDFAKWGGRFLKQWADKWTFSGEVKGTSGVFRPEVFIVTSNYSIAQMGFRQQDQEAIEERFTSIYKDSKEDQIDWTELGFPGEVQDAGPAEEPGWIPLEEISLESINLI